MRAKLRRAALRTGLVVLLIFLGAAPITIRYLPSVLPPTLSLGQPVTAQDFSSTPEEDVSPAVVLDYASLAVRPLVQGGNYTETARILGMIGNLPPNVEHNLRTYLALLQELISILDIQLDSVKAELDQLRDLINDGAVGPAHDKVPEIEAHLEDASKRLDMLFAALQRIEDLYWPIDVSKQRADLEDLSSIMHEFEQLLANLKGLLEQADLRAETSLDLSVWPKPVWISGTLHVLTQLSSGSSALPGRAVDLWINGNATKLTLGQTGEVDWEYIVSSSERFDSLEVYATFTPTGEDSSIYRPARSANQTVPVEYYPVTLTFASSSNRLHVLENFTVQAKLVDGSARGLAEESVELMIDDAPIRSCVTDTAGECSIIASFPSGTPEGRHELYARFEPRSGIYAAALSEKIGIEIYYLKPTISLIALDGLTRVGIDNFAVSGQMLYVEGRVEAESAPLAEGLVVAFLGERELGRAFSNGDGAFKMAVNLPLDATGDQTLVVVSVPGKQWITSSVTSLVLKIVNSPIVFLGLGAIISATTVVSGRSLDLRSMFRRPRESEKGREPEVEPEKAEAKEEAVPATIEFRLDYLKGLDDARRCLRETYWETRRVLATLLQDAGLRSETHREYETRMSGRLADAAQSFSALTGLFELAEYSQRPLSRVEADEAINHAVLIAETMNVEVKK